MFFGVGLVIMKYFSILLDIENCICLMVLELILYDMCFGLFISML